MVASAAKRVIPLLDRVLIQRVKPQEKTASGILIPEKAQEAVNEGVVMAVGPGVFNSTIGKRVEMSLKEGDRVILPSFGGSPVKITGEELILFRYSLFPLILPYDLVFC